MQGSFGESLVRIEDNEEQELRMEIGGGGSGGLATMEAPTRVSSGDVQQPPAQPPVQPEWRPQRQWGKALKQPVVTLATVLGPTTYREKNDKDRRSLGYIGAQSKFFHISCR
jgi:hypothetical protein